MKLLKLRSHPVPEATSEHPQAEAVMLTEHAAVGLYRLDADGKLEQANSRLVQMLGFSSAAELIEARRDFRATLYADSEHAEKLE
ncbi:MAG: PAS domain-containing protein, partial [Gammaproteobacteria bacterium]